VGLVVDLQVVLGLRRKLAFVTVELKQNYQIFISFSQCPGYRTLHFRIHHYGTYSYYESEYSLRCECDQVF
jgi:hypothetical protein